MIEKLVLYRTKENEEHLKILRNAAESGEPVMLKNPIGEGNTQYLISSWEESLQTDPHYGVARGIASPIEVTIKLKTI